MPRGSTEEAKNHGRSACIGTDRERNERHTTPPSSLMLYCCMIAPRLTDLQRGPVHRRREVPWHGLLTRTAWRSVRTCSPFCATSTLIFIVNVKLWSLVAELVDVEFATGVADIPAKSSSYLTFHACALCFMRLSEAWHSCNSVASRSRSRFSFFTDERRSPLVSSSCLTAVQYSSSMDAFRLAVLR
jgi:hypothetical protein